MEEVRIETQSQSPIWLLMELNKSVLKGTNPAHSKPPVLFFLWECPYLFPLPPGCTRCALSYMDIV